MPLANTPFRHDQRIVVSDDERLVLKIKPPEESGIASVILVSALVAAFIAALLVLIAHRYISPVTVLAIWLALTASCALYAMSEGTLVALASEDRLFIEWRNRLTRKKRRTMEARLSQLTGYEVQTFVDTDSDIFPHRIFELRLRVGDTRATWHCDSRELAKAVGEELLRLRPR